MGNEEKFAPLPTLPALPIDLQVVKVLDRIRFSTAGKESFEFYWFVREYPRVYRYHLDHAAARVAEIHGLYVELLEDFREHLSRPTESSPYEVSFSDTRAYRIYWDFEAFLGAVNSALDILARILTTAYSDQVPVSFNKLCSRRNLGGVVDILRKDKEKWVDRLKDYRDCFVHYTPVDNLAFISARQYKNGWEVRCRLPINPNERENLLFRYSKRVEVLRYMLSILRNIRVLDRKVATELRRMYRQGEYPSRKDGLFFVGRRLRMEEEGTKPGEDHAKVA